RVAHEARDVPEDPGQAMSEQVGEPHHREVEGEGVDVARERGFGAHRLRLLLLAEIALAHGIGDPHRVRGAPVAGTEPFVEENPEFMRMWTIVQAEGTRLLNEEPDAAATSIAVQLGISQEEAEKLLAGYIYPTLEEQAGPDYFGGEGLSEALLGTAEFLEEQGEIDALAEEGTYAAMPYGAALEEATR